MPNIYNYHNYRDFIRDSLEEKKSKNKHYSLRAFAKKLQISPGHLSLILTAKKNISELHAKILSQTLKLSGEEEIFFFLMIQCDQSDSSIRKTIEKKLNVERSKKVIKQKKVEGLSLRIKWTHLLIIVIVGHFKSLTKAAAFLEKHFQLETDLINKFIGELIQHGFLVHENGIHKSTSKRIVFSSENSNEILKSLHLDYLKVSIDQLYSKTPEDRFSVTEFLTIPKSMFPEVKKITNDYLDELTTIAEKNTIEARDVIGVCLHLNRFDT